MIIDNTQEMRQLLNALHLRKDEYVFVGDDKIDLLINGQQLIYAINATPDYVQQLFGKTKAWQQLTSFFVKGMTK